MHDLSRADHLDRLRQQAFDVLVIGGGITGAAVARDAARRGYRTALVEARDFSEGTSSRSSRLVHGGLRYLEHFEFDLVFEGSQERRTLLRIAPHLVRPLEFLFPIYEAGRVGRVKLDAGLWLYDALALFRNIERHQMLTAEALLEREPSLRPEGLLGGARYFDAQVDDARLVVTTVLSAAAAGASVANRLEALEVRTDRWPGHTTRVRDAESGREFEIDAVAVVCATGPWTEETRVRVGGSAGHSIHPTRGTHIHVRRDRVGHEGAFIFESHIDGRVMFVLPWRDLTLIGTTDDFDEGAPEDVAPTAGDVDYLLRSTNHLFPGVSLVPEDVIGAWAGLRPLVAESHDSAEEGAVSRDFVVEEDPRAVFTVAGGKLTSHRHMAEQTVDLVARLLAEAKIKPERRSDTARAPLVGGDFQSLDALHADVSRRADGLGVAAAGVARLVRAYGTRAHDLLDLVRDDPELAAPILEVRPHILAEAVYAARAEMALRVEDVVYRRTRIALETSDEWEEAARRVARAMAGPLEWSEARRLKEVERVSEIRRRDDAWQQAG